MEGEGVAHFGPQHLSRAVFSRVKPNQKFGQLGLEMITDCLLGSVVVNRSVSRPVPVRVGSLCLFQTLLLASNIIIILLVSSSNFVKFMSLNKFPESENTMDDDDIQAKDIEEKLKSQLRQLEVEHAVFERMVYKNKSISNVKHHFFLQNGVKVKMN
ncbi:hypothetical protein YC2023_065708 [Brassica napus]